MLEIGLNRLIKQFLFTKLQIKYKGMFLKNEIKQKA
jgi:hypothetical protein